MAAPKSKSTAVAGKEMFLPTLPGTEKFFGKTGLSAFEDNVDDTVEVVSIAPSSKGTNLIVELAYAEGKRKCKITLADLSAASDKNPNAQIVVNTSRPGFPLNEGDSYEVAKTFKFSRKTEGVGAAKSTIIAVSAAE